MEMERLLEHIREYGEEPDMRARRHWIFLEEYPGPNFDSKAKFTVNCHKQSGSLFYRKVDLGEGEKVVVGVVVYFGRAQKLELVRMLPIFSKARFWARKSGVSVASLRKDFIDLKKPVIIFPSR